MSDFIGAFVLAITGFVLGLTLGCSLIQSDTAVIKSVEQGKTCKYTYTTTEFNFRSDNVFNVGDTVKIVKYEATPNY